MIFCVFGGVPEWSKGTDCKSVGDAFEGSNPSPTIKLSHTYIQTAYNINFYNSLNL